MPKKQIFCDSCEAEFTISYKGDLEIKFCPMCGDELDLGWNSDEVEEE